jgi:hypothetical protein
MSTFSAHTISAVATIPGGSIVLGVKTGTVTMDESWSPYVQATLVCSVPSVEAVAALDPRAEIRVTVTVEQAFGDEDGDWNGGYRAPVRRTFMLMLRGRAINRKTAEMALDLSSDEGKLIDKSLVATAPERTYGLSARAAVALALGKIGAVLGPGAEDANLTTKALDPQLTNLIPNPGAEVSLVAVGAVNCTVTRDTTWKAHGAASFKLSAAVDGNSWMHIGGDGGGGMRLGMVPGKTYTFSATMRLTASLTVPHDNAVTARIIYRTAAGTYVEKASETINNTPGVRRISVTTSIPASATEAFVRLFCGGGGAVWYDDLMLVEGEETEPFDGSHRGDRDPGLYSTAWLGAAGLSTSTLTNLPNSDATIWYPGTSAWDYLYPITSAVGLRLWVDESQVWHLQKAWPADGLLSISPDTGVVEASDTISRNGPWFDSVVVIYTGNVDADGNRLPDRYDTAGAPGTLTLTLTYDRPYPGPGAAAYELSKATGKGRVLDLAAVSDYRATPGMALNVTLPDIPIQSGVLSSVQWAFPADTMTVGSRGLTDTPANAWALAEGSWASQTGSWAADN